MGTKTPGVIRRYDAEKLMSNLLNLQTCKHQKNTKNMLFIVMLVVSSGSVIITKVKTEQYYSVQTAVVKKSEGIKVSCAKQSCVSEKYWHRTSKTIILGPNKASVKHL